MIFHLLPVFDDIDEPAYAILGEPGKLPGRIPDFGYRHVDRRRGIFVIDEEFVSQVRKRTKRKAIAVCEECAAGKMCSAWDPAATPEMTPRSPADKVAPDPVVVERNTKAENAAMVLGLKWPCTHDEFSAAYKAAVFRAHPDRMVGGDEAAMAAADVETKRILLAKKELSEILEAGDRK